MTDLEKRVHSQSSGPTVCQNCKREFVIDASDFKFYEKIKVPPPTWCPECRLIRRLAWRNERSLYNRKCDLCGKPIISVFGPHTGLTVYCSPCWWSDKWDAMEYGTSFDTSKPFLLQLRELFQRVPVVNLFSLYPTLVNSEYTNMAGNLKNCYFITHSDFNENCFYGGFITNTKDSADNFMIDQCELCYENVNCQKCYRAFFSVDCESCNDVYFSKNCIGCSNCFGCANLRHKKYHIFNQPHTKAEYEKFIKENYPDSFSKIGDLIKKTRDHWLKFPQKYAHERHNHNITGDYIYNSKNTHDSFIISDMEDSRFCTFITHGAKTTDCYDFTHYGNS
ncbi:MAG: zinc-ribbon domain containing protein, partial [bacterium]|nr:zinc-ribbon domain containing protein [bacterium]